MKKQLLEKKEVSFLAIPKEEFINKLEDRILKGEEIKLIKSVTESQLSDFQDNYDSWNDINLEFLKQSFNVGDNDYYQDYSKAGCCEFFLQGSIEDDINESYELIETKIKHLKTLIEKTEFIKCNNDNFSKNIVLGVDGLPMLTISKSRLLSLFEESIRCGKGFINKAVYSPEGYEILLNDYNIWNNNNLDLLRDSFSVSLNDYYEGYKEVGEISDLFDSPVEFIYKETKLKNKISSKCKNLESLINKLELREDLIMAKKESVNCSSFDKTKVFIVHGHDDLAKTEVARFVEKLGFDAIILHEQASRSKTIIEKIEEYSNVGFGIVIYTACDEGKAKGEDNLKDRARQNVVLEHGFLMGKLGRRNVCTLVKETVETPNDISGVVYTPMVNGWEMSVAKEMDSAGYDVNFNKLFKK